VRILIAIEQIAGEGNFLAERAAQQIAGADAKLLADEVDASELDCGVELRAIVVKGGCGIADFPVELLELERIVAEQMGLQAANRGFRALAAAAHLSEANKTVVRFDFDNSADKAAPVRSVRMAKGRFQGDRYGGGTNVYDFHFFRHSLGAGVALAPAQQTRNAKVAQDSIIGRACDGQAQFLLVLEVEGVCNAGERHAEIR
jgi:hypothetical protein